MLIDVVSLVGGGEDFGFVDVVDAEFLQNLGFGEVSDAALGHDRDRDRAHDLTNNPRRGHAGHAAFGADLRRDAFQGHDGDGSGFFGDGGLCGSGDVHDDAALEHFGEAGLEAKAGIVAVGLGHVWTPEKQLSALSCQLSAKPFRGGAPVGFRRSLILQRAGENYWVGWRIDFPTMAPIPPKVKPSSGPIQMWLRPPPIASQ